MLRTCALALCGALWPLIASAAQPVCAIKDAAAAGHRAWLLCEEYKVLASNGDATNWDTQSLPSTEEELTTIRFLDSNRGFVVGERGTLFATSDGGREWRPVTLPTNEDLSAIHSVGESVWIAGWGGIILHSGDGGQTWQEQTSGVSQGLEGIYFADAQHGWAVGWVGTILRTTDGGEHLEQGRGFCAVCDEYGGFLIAISAVFHVSCGSRVILRGRG